MYFPNETVELLASSFKEVKDKVYNVGNSCPDVEIDFVLNSLEEVLSKHIINDLIDNNKSGNKVLMAKVLASQMLGQTLNDFENRLFWEFEKHDKI